MNKKFNVKSKLNVVPTKGAHIWVIVVNIALALIMLSGIVKIFMNGFSIGVLGYMCIAFVVVTAFRNRPENREHYEFSMAEVCITAEGLTIRYPQIQRYKGRDYMVEIPAARVHTLEFSDKLCCLHIAGTVNRYVEGSNKVESGTDHYLYMEEALRDEILDYVVQMCRKPIRFMDREQ